MPTSIEGNLEVVLNPLGRRLRVSRGTSILDASRTAGVQIASLCGGMGICESCIVHLVSGELSPLTLEEKSARSEGWLGEQQRLACQASPASDVIIEIPPRSLSTPQRLQLEGQTGHVHVEPTTTATDVHVATSDEMSPETCWKTVLAALAEVGVQDVHCVAGVLAALPERVQEFSGNLRVVLDDREMIAILPQSQNRLGLAVDLGTTKIVAYLLDLESGETLARAGVMNPQISYGEDVVSRISFANQGDNQRMQLRQVVADSLGALTDELCLESGVEPTSIVESVIVGNTVMHHSFLGLPLHPLGVAPFRPVVTGSFHGWAHLLGLTFATGARIYLPNNIAGYIGADHMAMLLATGFAEQRGPTLAVDIGTNTEISLQLGEKILSCSCASGPAFEGAHIRDGMRAASGAIERVQARDGSLHWQTIDNMPPVGICGSGILDAVAAMRSLGWIDRSGRIQAENLDPDCSHPDGIRLATAEQSGHGADIVITRQDVHEIQLAQAAIRAGIEVLLEQAALSAHDLEHLYLAGAFGTYLHVSSAMLLGMLPAIDPSSCTQVGNAAGEGARQLLLSRQKRKEITLIHGRVEYIELTTHPQFTDLYMKYLYLGS